MIRFAVFVVFLLCSLASIGRSQSISGASPPEIVAPMNGTHVSNAIALRWSHVQGARAYEIQLWLESLTLWRDSVIADTQAVFNGFLPAEYSVTVRAIGDSEMTDWSRKEYSFISDLIGVDEPLNTCITVYPNPASGSCTITLPDDYGVSRCDVIDGRGSVQLSNCPIIAQRIDLSGLPAGVYFLRLSSHADAQLQRLVIER